MWYEKLKRALPKALSVKTIMTLLIVVTLCVRVLQGADLSDGFIMIATAVITYYFCKDNTIEERMCEHEKNFH